MSEWISVKDRLPEKDKSVLAFTEDEILIAWSLGGLHGGFYGYSSFCNGVDGPLPVTHWMPLPAPPEVK